MLEQFKGFWGAGVGVGVGSGGSGGSGGDVVGSDVAVFVTACIGGDGVGADGADVVADVAGRWHERNSLERCIQELRAVNTRRATTCVFVIK